jgi:hypothetical protein
MATGTSHHGSRRHTRHLRRAAIGIVVAAAPRYTIMLENTLISGLIEEDGTYPPAP